MRKNRTSQLLAPDPAPPSFQPLAAIFATRGPVNAEGASILSQTITCVSSYTSTSSGQDSDADVDMDQ